MICLNCFANIGRYYYHANIGSLCPLCFQPISISRKSKKINNIDLDISRPLPRNASSREYSIVNGSLANNYNSNSNTLLISKLETKHQTSGCRACGSNKNLTIDHIIPRSLGGSNKYDNKQILCFSCNNLKKNLPPGKNGWWPDILIKHLIYHN